MAGRRQLALLAFLLVNANRAVSSDALLEGVWHEREPGRRAAVKRLQVAIVRLRNVLEPLGEGESVLRTVSGGYLLQVAGDELDCGVFEAGLREGRRALAGGDADGAAELLRAALALWRGPALAEVAFEDFAQSEIRRLEELRVSALEARLEADLAAGRHVELVGELEELGGEQPLRERLHAQRMLALYRCGRQAEALAAFQQARGVLVAELGLEPGPELRGLHAAILRHDAGLALAPPEGERAPEIALESSPALRELEQSALPDDSELRGARVDAASPSTDVEGAGARLRDGRARAVDALVAESVERARLPLAPNATLGRDADVRQIGQQLTSGGVQVLTLTGPGGIGKTRLALEAARTIEHRFADGVRFVGLGALRRADAVPDAVAEALAVVPTPGATPEQAM